MIGKNSIYYNVGQCEWFLITILPNSINCNHLISWWAFSEQGHPWLPVMIAPFLTKCQVRVFEQKSLSHGKGQEAQTQKGEEGEGSQLNQEGWANAVSRANDATQHHAVGTIWPTPTAAAKLMWVESLIWFVSLFCKHMICIGSVENWRTTCACIKNNDNES